MRSFHRTTQIIQMMTFMKRFQHDGVSREVVLARWNANSTDSLEKEKEIKGLIGKGMKFASSVTSVSWVTPRSNITSTVSDVSWDLCERLDFYVQYSVPSNWLISERVSENSISIQCRPPLTTCDRERPTVHGISLNCFAYRQKVKEPNSDKLLNLFLQRFNASVSNSMEVISQSSGCEYNTQDIDSSEKNNISEKLASRLGCAVAEITFTPVVGEPLAHGLCRAFYNSNHRFHYVVVVAVPGDEFEVSKDLLTHALLAVVESRVEAAAKRT